MRKEGRKGKEGKEKEQHTKRMKEGKEREGKKGGTCGQKRKQHEIKTREGGRGRSARTTRSGGRKQGRIKKGEKREENGKTIRKEVEEATIWKENMEGRRARRYIRKEG